VLAHVAEPSGELGEPLSVGGLTPPGDRQMARLQKLRAGDEGDTGFAEDFHGGAKGFG
jgi:hypothetical protein